MRRLWLAVFVPLTACASTAQEARQSWQESRQICQKIKGLSERDFCMDMAWRNYRDVLLMNAKQMSTTDADARHARDEIAICAVRWTT